jgi:hypothetical protein
VREITDFAVLRGFSVGIGRRFFGISRISLRFRKYAFRN